MASILEKAVKSSKKGRPAVREKVTLRTQDPGKKLSQKELAAEVGRQRDIRIDRDGNKLGFLESIRVDEKAAIKAFAGLASSEARQEGAADDLERVRLNLLGRRSTILGGSTAGRAGFQASNFRRRTRKFSGRIFSPGHPGAVFARWWG